MKQTIFIFIVVTLCFSAYGQQGSEVTFVKPVAYDRNFWMYGPHKPIQVFIGEVQGTNGGLLKLVYLPKTDGLRGGATEFVNTKALNSKTIWKIKLRHPSEEEKILCRTDNFLRSTSKKISLSSENEPLLRFRSTQFEAFIQFSNFEKIPCMILDAKVPPETQLE